MPAYLSQYWGVVLSQSKALIRRQVERSFDLVSEDGTIVGDCKFFRSLRVPAAK